MKVGSSKTWLRRQFEFEYCAECGGDSKHHTPVIVLGNWFALCRYPVSKETNWEQHPVIAEYRTRREGKV